MSLTTAQAAAEKRRKNRRLPSVDVPEVKEPELARSMEAIKEHLRMYEGDSGAPKERFVTIAELENAGLLTADVKSKFAYISTVSGSDVTAPSVNAVRTTRVVTGGGASKLGQLTDVNVTGEFANYFLRFDGVNWKDWDLFGKDNTWKAAQQFNKHIRFQEQATDPAAVPGIGYLYVKPGTTNDLYFETDTGQVVQITDNGTVAGTGSEVNDLTDAVVWDDVPDANITEGSVTQHQAALTITESQISDLAHTPDAHTHVEADITDLGSYSVIGHTHVEADITDLGTYLTAGADETITGDWDFSGAGELGINMDIAVNNGKILYLWDTGPTNYGTLKHDGSNLLIDSSVGVISTSTPIQINDDGAALSIWSSGNGSAASGFQAWYDGLAVRQGYFGMASGGTSDIYLQAEVGDLRLGATGGQIRNLNDTEVTGYVSASGYLATSYVGDPAPAAGTSTLDANMLHLDGKEAIDGNDTFLRLNQNNEFAGGVYSPYLIQAGGGFVITDSVAVRYGSGDDVYEYFDGTYQIKDLNDTTQLFLDGGVAFSPKATAPTSDENFMYPVIDGAAYNSNSSTETGFVRIAMGAGSLTDNTMCQFLVKGYNYSVPANGKGGGGWCVMISGYYYASVNWNNINCSIVYGTPPFDTIQLGEATSEKYVLLGVTGSTWNYPQIMVCDMLTGYNHQIGPATGAWTIDINASTPSGWALTSGGAFTIGAAFNWRTAGMDGGGSVTVSTSAASGGLDGDIHYKY